MAEVASTKPDDDCLITTLTLCAGTFASKRLSVEVCTHCCFHRYEDLFLETLHGAGYTRREDPCIVQSFDPDSLRYMRARTNLTCVILRSSDTAPITNAQLDQYKRWGFDGMGINKVDLRSHRSCTPVSSS